MAIKNTISSDFLSSFVRNRVFDCCLSSIGRQMAQSKTLFLAIFYPCLSIVKSVFDCRLPDVSLEPDLA